MTDVNFGGGISPVSQLGTVTPGSVAVFVAEGIIAKGTGGEIGVFPEAPTDGRDYLRNGATESWVPLHITAEVGEAPAAPLGSLWVRQGSTQSWQPAFTQTAADTRYAPISTVSFPEAPPGGPYGRQPGAWVAVAPLLSPTFTGTPSAPSPPSTDSSTRLATTAFVQNAVSALGGGTVTSITAGTGLTGGTITASGTIALDPATALTAIGGAPVASPALSGVPTAPTATAGTDTTQIATTAFVKAAVDAIDALPTGGAQYDVLSKASATDGDVEWRAPGARPSNNTVVGRGGANAGSVNNTIVGFNAMNAATSGSSNVAIGSNALAISVSPASNVAVGPNAMASLTGGGTNVAVGPNAMQFVSSVQSSTAVGFGALNCEPTTPFTGFGNTAVGRAALFRLTGGAAENVAIGHFALGGIDQSGSRNVAIGSWAGRYYGSITLTQQHANGNNSIFIGNNTQPLADNQTNQIVIGHEIVGNGSDTITLGNQNTTALYTRAGLVLGNNPTGGAQGTGTVNCTDGYFINGEPHGFAQTAGWVSGTDPGGAILYTNNTGRTLKIISIVGQREIANSTPAVIDVYSAVPNMPIASGTKITVVASFDAGDTAPEQTINLTSGALLLPPGERLGLVVAAGAEFDDSVASISVYLA